MSADESQKLNAAASENIAQAEPKEEAEELDFSKLLEQHDQELKQQDFERGMIVEGTIVQIGSEFVYVNIGSKAEASIPLSELLNPEDGKLSHVVGENLKARVVGFDESGIKLSRTMKAGNIEIEEAYKNGMAVKARVKMVNKGGFELDLMGSRAFCPISHMQRGKIDDPEAFVGQSFDFKIIKYAKKGRDLVLSRTALLDDENKLKREEVLASLKVGAIYDAKVISFVDYGAFLDIGGIEGLLHIKEMTHRHITKPSEVLSLGQELKVVLVKIEESAKGPRLSFSLKQLEADPFEAALNELEVGSRLQGKVVRTTKFGAFVELMPGVEGLVHLSELSWNKACKHADEVVKTGMPIDVTVLSIDHDNRRISLGHKEARTNPWTDIESRFSVGQTVDVKVESNTEFGIFVKLEPQVTALLPLSEIGVSTAELAQAKPGDQIQAQIIQIDVERKRITLSTKAEGEQRATLSGKRPARHEQNNDREEKRQNHRKQQDESSYQDSKSFGSLGDVFALAKKKK